MPNSLESTRTGTFECGACQHRATATVTAEFSEYRIRRQAGLLLSPENLRKEAEEHRAREVELALGAVACPRCRAVDAQKRARAVRNLWKEWFVGAYAIVAGLLFGAYEGYTTLAGSRAMAIVYLVGGVFLGFALGGFLAWAGVRRARSFLSPRVIFDEPYRGAVA